MERAIAWVLDLLRSLWRRLGVVGAWIWKLVVQELLTNVYVVGGLVYAFVRAMGITVQTGQHALRFTLGRAGKKLEPGFHWLVPFVQTAKVVPTRSRTIDLEDQRVVTRDGLVVLASANVVWRVEDITKSLIEVDDLLRAMREWLAVAVGRVLSRADRAELGLRSEEGASAGLDAALEAELGELLAPWGVRVERAGFQTIAPSPRTARLLQTRERVRTRRRAHRELGGHAAALFAASGRAEPPRRRALRAAERERASRRRRREALALVRAARADDDELEGIAPPRRPKAAPPKSTRTVPL